MPREVKVLLYQFDELSAKAKEKARDWYRQGALDYEWWESVYEDAKNIGLTITSFDLGRSNSIEGKLTRDIVDVAQAIVKEHGEGCETRKDAEIYLAALGLIERGETPRLLQEWPYTQRGRHAFPEMDTREELDEGFRKALFDDYLDILRKEEEYLTSDEQVDESIRANKYEFNKDGRRART